MRLCGWLGRQDRGNLSRTENPLVVIGNGQFDIFSQSFHRRCNGMGIGGGAQAVGCAATPREYINATSQNGNQQEHKGDLNVSGNHFAAPRFILRVATASASAPAIRSAEILKPFLVAGTSMAMAGAAIECN